MIRNNHYLLGCRLDNWLILLAHNKFKINLKNIPQAIFITLTSLLLFPFALLERLVFGWSISKTKIKKSPVFILGHWRSGTTYLHNTLSKDKQFGWADPINTLTYSYSIILRPILSYIQKRLLKKARPMDNMEYALDSPMEETFAMGSISDFSIVHLMSFSKNCDYYCEIAFAGSLNEKKKKHWFRAYNNILKKLSFVNEQKQLLLKSPDNTCRMGALYKEYPDSKFIYIYRNPYDTVVSTINMFKKLSDIMALQQAPDDEALEDFIIALFVKMHEYYFRDSDKIPKSNLIEIRYEDYILDPLTHLKQIYKHLDLDGFELAEQSFEGYIKSQSNYQRNKLNDNLQLRKKVQKSLAFYYERYGYKKMEEPYGLH